MMVTRNSVYSYLTHLNLKHNYERLHRIQALVIQAHDPHVVKAPVNLHVKKTKFCLSEKIINSGLGKIPASYIKVLMNE